MRLVPNPPPKVLLIWAVNSHDSVTLFIDPDRSTTKQMSRGLPMATALAEILSVLTPKIRLKKRRFPPVVSLHRVVTFTALPNPADGVKTRVVEFHEPYCTSLAASATF